VPSSWHARPTYKGHVAYATDRGGAFTQAGRVPLGLRPALRHVFETTSVIRGLWKKRMLQHFRVHTWGEIKGNRFQRIPPCALWREPPMPSFLCWGRGLGLGWETKRPPKLKWGAWGLDDDLGFTRRPTRSLKINFSVYVPGYGISVSLSRGAIRLCGRQGQHRLHQLA
jgi:hypothetical protein